MWLCVGAWGRALRARVAAASATHRCQAPKEAPVPRKSMATTARPADSQADCAARRWVSHSSRVPWEMHGSADSCDPKGAAVEQRARAWARTRKAK